MSVLAKDEELERLLAKAEHTSEGLTALFIVLRMQLPITFNLRQNTFLVYVLHVNIG